jgi:murein L,D-transpeptidase YafK
MRTTLALCLLASVALGKDRVSKARENQAEPLKKLFADAGLTYPPDELYLRAFKEEKALEVWAGPRGKPLKLIQSYPICAASGELGPKREEGDLQVPEGFYEIKSFNPTSSFHLSMEVSYPNASDRLLGTKGKLGGLIYLHGNCASIGCIAITDGPAEQVYLMASDAKLRRLPIHIFPRRLDEAGLKALEKSPHFEFWKQLQPGYALFEQTRRPPTAKVDAKTGAYSVRSPPSDPSGNPAR